ncbi:MAG: hypothetical protein FWE40_05485 [Oscillospiraceae bacterium]|nr:hypothetical protein [Oscillospiraceae bacterium]
MNKNEVQINGSTILRGGWPQWDYPQTDGDGSGATDENVMHRDVLPSRYRHILTFRSPDEALASQLMQVRSLPELNLQYYDIRSRSWMTRRMYPVGGPIIAQHMLSENGDILFQDYELRFIQLIPD